MSNFRGIEINEQNVSTSGAFFSCCTEVLQSEVFIRTVVVVEFKNVVREGDGSRMLSMWKFLLYTFAQLGTPTMLLKVII